MIVILVRLLQIFINSHLTLLLCGVCVVQVRQLLLLVTPQQHDKPVIEVLDSATPYVINKYIEHVPLSERVRYFSLCYYKRCYVKLGDIDDRWWIVSATTFFVGYPFKNAPISKKSPWRLFFEEHFRSFFLLSLMPSIDHRPSFNSFSAQSF